MQSEREGPHLKFCKREASLAKDGISEDDPVGANEVHIHEIHLLRAAPVPDETQDHSTRTVIQAYFPLATIPGATMEAPVVRNDDEILPIAMCPLPPTYYKLPKVAII